MTTRRQFLKTAALAGAGLFVPLNGSAARTSAPHSHAFVVAQQGTQTPLPGSKIAQFVDPLPLLSVAGGPMQTVLPSLLGGTDDIVLNMVEAQAKVMPSTFLSGTNETCPSIVTETPRDASKSRGA